MKIWLWLRQGIRGRKWREEMDREAIEILKDLFSEDREKIILPLNYGPTEKEKGK